MADTLKRLDSFSEEDLIPILQADYLRSRNEAIRELAKSREVVDIAEKVVNRILHFAEDPLHGGYNPDHVRFLAFLERRGDFE